MATIRRENWGDLGPIMGKWLKDQFERIDLMQSCLSCRHFDETNEVCRKANGLRPPARVIANGCPQYDDMRDIPF